MNAPTSTTANPLREGLSSRPLPQPCSVIIFGASGDLTYRKLIPAELQKGFGFVNGKGLNALSPVAVTPDELGGAWSDEKGAGKLDYRMVCHVRGHWFGNPNAADDMTFSLFDLVSHAAKTRPLMEAKRDELLAIIRK